MNYLSLVLRNLTRNKRRTILTTLSITVSIFIFASLISLPGLLNKVLRDRANSLRLICHSKASLFYMLPESYRRRIEALLGTRIRQRSGVVVFNERVGRGVQVDGAVGAEGVDVPKKLNGLQFAAEP